MSDKPTHKIIGNNGMMLVKDITDEATNINRQRMEFLVVLSRMPTSSVGDSVYMRDGIMYETCHDIGTDGGKTNTGPKYHKDWRLKILEE